MKNDIEEVEELSEIKQEILDRVSNVMNKACDYRNSFHCFEYLWIDERNEFMNQFLRYGRVLSLEELERRGEEDIPECSPSLQQFKEQVSQMKCIFSINFVIELFFDTYLI